MNSSKTKKIVTISMLCALAYIAAAVLRVPLVLFLRYDPKDIIIAIGGLIFGPFVSFVIAVTVSVLQLFTTSATGILGFLMNVISSCAFSCPAAVICKKKRGVSGVVCGLLTGWACQVVAMMCWNYLIAPIYMGYPREEISGLLLSAFLPFNLIKGGLNAGAVLLLYKPVTAILRRSGNK